jgi:hypothetical protein
MTKTYKIEMPIRFRDLNTGKFLKPPVDKEVSRLEWMNQKEDLE